MIAADPGNPDILRLRSSGCLSWFIGLLAMLVGGFVMVAPTVIPGVEVTQAAAIAAGLLFIAVGFCFMFVRLPTYFDRRRRVMVKECRIGMPISHSEQRFDDFGSVELSRETRRSNNSSYTVFPVRLTGPAKPIDLSCSKSYEQARGDAERMARFVRLPLIDTSTGEPVVREPEHLDESLVERLHRVAALREPLPSPDSPQCTVHESGYQLEIDIPACSGNRRLLLALLILAPMLLFFIGPMIIMRRSGAGMPATMLAIMAAVGLGIPVLLAAVVFFGDTRRTTLRLDRRSLELHRRRRIGQTRVTIPLQELEELVCVRSPEAKGAAQARRLFGVGPGILVRSDRRTVQFAEGIAEPERRYLVRRIEDFLLST